MRMMMTTRRCQSCHGVQPDYWKKQDILNKGYKIAQYFNNNNINNFNNNNDNNSVVINHSNPTNPSTSPSNKPVNGELSSVSSAGKVDHKESQEVRVARLKARFAHVIAKYSGNTKIEKCDEEEKIIKRKDGHQVNTKAVDRRLQERQLARLAFEKLEQTVQVDDYGLVKKFEELAGCSVSSSGYAGSCSAWKKSLKNLGLVMKTGYGY